jgi:hypothetical protein
MCVISPHFDGFWGFLMFFSTFWCVIYIIRWYWMFYWFIRLKIDRKMVYLAFWWVFFTVKMCAYSRFMERALFFFFFFFFFHFLALFFRAFIHYFPFFYYLPFNFLCAIIKFNRIAKGLFFIHSKKKRKKKKKKKKKKFGVGLMILSMVFYIYKSCKK